MTVSRVCLDVPAGFIEGRPSLARRPGKPLGQEALARRLGQGARETAGAGRAPDQRNATLPVAIS